MPSERLRKSGKPTISREQYRREQQEESFRRMEEMIKLLQNNPDATNAELTVALGMKLTQIPQVAGMRKMLVRTGTIIPEAAGAGQTGAGERTRNNIIKGVRAGKKPQQIAEELGLQVSSIYSGVVKLVKEGRLSQKEKDSLFPRSAKVQEVGHRPATDFDRRAIELMGRGITARDAVVSLGREGLLRNASMAPQTLTNWARRMLGGWGPVYVEEAKNSGALVYDEEGNLVSIDARHGKHRA